MWIANECWTVPQKLGDHCQILELTHNNTVISFYNLPNDANMANLFSSAENKVEWEDGNLEESLIGFKISGLDEDSTDVLKFCIQLQLEKSDIIYPASKHKLFAFYWYGFEPTFTGLETFVNRITPVKNAEFITNIKSGLLQGINILKNKVNQH